MQHIIKIDCPPEILLGLHLDASQFAELIKQEAAITLFCKGKLSSGMAARWLGILRAHFFTKSYARKVGVGDAETGDILTTRDSFSASHSIWENASNELPPLPHTA